jgi:hypothetical protein
VPDWIGPATATNTLEQVKEDVDNGIRRTYIQTLTIKTEGGAYQAVYSRTVTNFDARGKVGPLTIRLTTPVITAIAP